MKRLSVFFCFLFLFLCIASSANALVFTETFLRGTGGDNRLPVLEGQASIFRFDLTTLGNLTTNYANVVNVSGGTELPGTQRLPSLGEDVSTFIPSMYKVDDVTVSFVISGIDSRPSPTDDLEKLLLRTTGAGEEKELLRFTGQIGANEEFIYSSPLIPTSFLDDGKLRLKATALPLSIDNNDFRMQRVTLTVNATKVPEPATMLLFGTGIIGLAGIRKRFKK